MDASRPQQEAQRHVAHGKGAGQPESARGREHPLVFTTAQLERLYASFAVPIYGFIYSRVGNREDAEDLTSQVFMKSMRLLSPTAQPQEVEAYLYRVARTSLADHWRRYAALRVMPIDDAPAALEVQESDEDGAPSAMESLAGELEQILERLPQNYRRVLELRFFQGCSIKQTAKAMQVTETNAKVLQYRAIQRAAALARETASS